jgi:hypothetical protein
MLDRNINNNLLIDNKPIFETMGNAPSTFFDGMNNFLEEETPGGPMV